jgi:hypothetical protein
MNVYYPFHKLNKQWGKALLLSILLLQTVHEVIGALLLLVADSFEQVIGVS